MSAITTFEIPARTIKPPVHLSETAKMGLAPQPNPRMPPVEDTAAWRAFVEARDAEVLPVMRAMGGQVPAQVEERTINGAKIFDISLPAPPDAPKSRGIILDFHGGGLYMGGGEICRYMSTFTTAIRTLQRVWTVDYRMPPDHPYPAALDDGMAVYRGLLKERSPEEIIVMGASAGGNLAAALLLRARAEGLPMPAGLILCTPEVDLTESGDSFQVNEGVEPVVHSLMAANLLYAGGQDLRSPLLSPLFGDLTGFPPTILTTGTRDLFLSNTVRMHRALRAVDVPAELHVLEAGPHIGFPGAPEDEEITKELRRFVGKVFTKAT